MASTEKPSTASPSSSSSSSSASSPSSPTPLSVLIPYWSVVPRQANHTYVVHKFDCRVVILETRYRNQIKSNMMAQTAKVPYQQYIVHCAKYSRRKVQMQKCKQLKRSLGRVAKCTHEDTQKATLWLCIHKYIHVLVPEIQAAQTHKYGEHKHTNTGSRVGENQGWRRHVDTPNLQSPVVDNKMHRSYHSTHQPITNAPHC